MNKNRIFQGVINFNKNQERLNKIWIEQFQGKNQIFSAILCSRGGLMVSALDSGASGPGSSPGRGQCVVFLGKTLYSHSASLHPGV